MLDIYQQFVLSTLAFDPSRKSLIESIKMRGAMKCPRRRRRNLRNQTHLRALNAKPPYLDLLLPLFGPTGQRIMIFIAMRI
jgi:hypothetical protein